MFYEPLKHNKNSIYLWQFWENLQFVCSKVCLLRFVTSVKFILFELFKKCISFKIAKTRMFGIQIFLFFHKFEGKCLFQGRVVILLFVLPYDKCLELWYGSENFFFSHWSGMLFYVKFSHNSNIGLPSYY